MYIDGVFEVFICKTRVVKQFIKKNPKKIEKRKSLLFTLNILLQLRLSLTPISCRLQALVEWDPATDPLFEGDGSLGGAGRDQQSGEVWIKIIQHIGVLYAHILKRPTLSINIQIV